VTCLISRTIFARPKRAFADRGRAFITFISKPSALLACLLVFSFILATHALAQKRKRRAPTQGGRVGVVVDERLAALRDAPDLSANLLGRLGRGRSVALTGAGSTREGVTFYRVAVTRRTGGWLQSDAVAVASRAREDERLLRLIRGSTDFDRLARAQIFLDMFPRSRLRPAVLLLLGDAAEEAARRLSREAERRLDEREMVAGGAPVASYYLNYSGLDRYRKQGVGFVFDAATKQFHYDGAAWREVARRYPRSPEADEARARLEARAAR
jgi:hypothetical protein